MATYARTQEIEHRIGTAGRFALRLTSGEVDIRATDGDLVRVRAQYDLRASSDEEADRILERVRFREGRAPGGLELSEPRGVTIDGAGALARFLGISPGAIETRVSVEVPQAATVDVNGVSADLTATGLRGTQHYRTVSGDLVLTDLGGEVRVQSVSGDVSLRAGAPLGLDARSVSGDLSAAAPRYEELRASTVSGDVEIEGRLAARRSHRVETVSGDLAIGVVGGLALEVRGLSSEVHANVAHRSEGSRDRRRYLIGDAAASLAFSSMSGDVWLREPRRTDAEADARAEADAHDRAAASAGAQLDDADQLEILRAVERGEIDVDEAARRLGTGR